MVSGSAGHIACPAKHCRPPLGRPESLLRKSGVLAAFRAAYRLNPPLRFAQQLLARGPATAFEFSDQGFWCDKSYFGPAGGQVKPLPGGGNLGFDGIDALQIDSVLGGEGSGRLGLAVHSMQKVPF